MEGFKMSLSIECKKLGISPDTFSETVGVPLKTLYKWTKSKPDTVHHLLNSIRYIKLLNRLDDITEPLSSSTQLYRTGLAQRNDITKTKNDDFNKSERLRIEP